MWCWVTFGEQSMVISRERRRDSHLLGAVGECEKGWTDETNLSPLRSAHLWRSPSTSGSTLSVHPHPSIITFGLLGCREPGAKAGEWLGLFLYRFVGYPWNLRLAIVCGYGVLCVMWTLIVLALIWGMEMACESLLPGSK